MTEKTGKSPCAALTMAFVCPWPCVAEEIHPKPKKLMHTAAVSFAQALSVLVIKGDSLSIKISLEEYEKGVDDCKRLLHGRMVMSKGDKPY